MHDVVRKLTENLEPCSWGLSPYRHSSNALAISHRHYTGRHVKRGFAVSHVRAHIRIRHAGDHVHLVAFEPLAHLQSIVRRNRDNGRDQTANSLRRADIARRRPFWLRDDASGENSWPIATTPTATSTPATQAFALTVTPFNRLLSRVRNMFLSRCHAPWNAASQ